MARRAFSSSSSTLPSTRKLLAGGAPGGGGGGGGGVGGGGGRAVGGGGGGGGRRSACGWGGSGRRRGAAVAMREKPERARRDARGGECGPDQHHPGPAGMVLIGRLRLGRAPEGSDGELPFRSESGVGCWCSLSRQRLRHGAFEHRLGLAWLDRGRQHREDLGALGRRAQLLPP